MVELVEAWDRKHSLWRRVRRIGSPVNMCEVNAYDLVRTGSVLHALAHSMSVSRCLAEFRPFSSDSVAYPLVRRYVVRLVRSQEMAEK